MNSLHRNKPFLGTFVEVLVEDSVSDKALISLSNDIFSEIQHIESLMSFHNQTSELSVINRTASTKPIEMSTDMACVIKQALALSHATNGDYDISIAPKLVSTGVLPDYGYAVDAEANWQNIEVENNHIYFNRPLILDLGGIAKGYAVDKALAVVNGACQTIVNAGGDLKMSHWQNNSAAIRVPFSMTGATVEVQMQAPALATSGHYLLEDSIAMVSTTNDAIDREISVSVFAELCMVADALTKVAVLHDSSEEVLSSYQASIIRLNRSGEFVAK